MTASGEMFSGCKKLAGYSDSNTDIDYAHTGTVDDKIGYFTAK